MTLDRFIWHLEDLKSVYIGAGDATVLIAGDPEGNHFLSLVSAEFYTAKENDFTLTPAIPVIVLWP
jgi:hypothetical protein